MEATKPASTSLKEGKMDRREELLRLYTEWTRKYVEADKRLKGMLPKVANVSMGEKLEPWVVTEESLARFEKVESEVKEALSKLREIRVELSNLPPKKKQR
jgi:hypothetical protein